MGSEELIVAEPNKTLPPFSPYWNHYYCSKCRKWILKSRAHRGRNGYPLCPYCHRPLRLSPKNSKKRREG